MSDRLVAVVTGCQGCGACLLTCPERAFRPTPAGPVAVARLCVGCGECVEVCPVDAISLVPTADLTWRQATEVS